MEVENEQQKMEEKVSSLLLPVIEELGFELVDVEFVKEGANRYLRLLLIIQKEWICRTVKQ